MDILMTTEAPRLRISHLVVVPVLVWDDGAELTPGPEASPNQLALSQIADFVAALPAQVAELQASMEQEPKAQD